jgi:nucleoid-associated protein YgaU
MRKGECMNEKKDRDPWNLDPPEENKTRERPGTDTWDTTQWHEVKRGETLWKIAEQYYGDGRLYQKIFEANSDVLKDPNHIRAGQKLRIP